jgi:SRSO17 transposase
VLRRLHRLIAPRFARAEPRDRAFAFLRGMVLSAERRNASRLAESAGEPRPDGMQRLLTTARWDADELRDDLRDVIVEHLGAPDAVLVLNEQGFAKKGDRSVGVARQFSPSSGAVENCQVAVFLTYAAPRAQAIIDRELYLPAGWARDPVRRSAARVPADVPFRGPGRLGWEMLDRALAAGVPAAWVAAEAPFGTDAELRRRLAGRAIPHVLGLASATRPGVIGLGGGRRVAPEEVAASIPAHEWLTTTDRDDPVRRGGACHSARVPLRRTGNGGLDEWLLVRRDGRGTRLYACAAPRATTLRELAEVARQAELAPQCAASARREVGLDHYEVRLWKAWYRHITLGLLAHAGVTLAGTGTAP